MAGLDELQSRPWAFGFHAAMRLIEREYAHLPRVGEAERPDKEPVRIAQDPTLTFAPAPVSRFRAPSQAGPGRLTVTFAGLFGPQGALPLHLTEHAAERMRDLEDAGFAEFVNLFHHRLMMLLHRAWAMAQPTVSRDRLEDRSFQRYVGSLCGRGNVGGWGLDGIHDVAKLQFAGRLASTTRNAEGLEAMIGAYFEVRVAVHPFVGEWIDVPEASQWRLGAPLPLGESTLAGARTFVRGHKFRLVLGPLTKQQFDSFAPDSPRMRRLSDWVRSYVGDELSWDLELRLQPGAATRPSLSKSGTLGFNTWLGQPALDAAVHSVVLQPPSLQPPSLQPSSTAVR